MVTLGGIGIFRIIWVLCAVVCVAGLYYNYKSTAADRDTKKYRWFKSLVMWVVFPIGLVSLIFDLYLSGNKGLAAGVTGGVVGIGAVYASKGARDSITSGIKNKLSSAKTAVTSRLSSAKNRVTGFFGR